MPKRSPVLSLRIKPRFRSLRGQRTLKAMESLTKIHPAVLSQLERGERLPRPRDLEGLEKGYGSQEGWYAVMLESDEVKEEQ